MTFSEGIWVDKLPDVQRNVKRSVCSFQVWQEEKKKMFLKYLRIPVLGSTCKSNNSTCKQYLTTFNKTNSFGALGYCMNENLGFIDLI